MLAKVTCFKILKRTDKKIKSYDEKSEIYLKFLKMGQFVFAILDRPEPFSR